MKKTDKHIDLIAERLNVIKRITLSDATELLNISESSVRRLFSKMERSGLAIRIHGGLTEIPSNKDSYDYNSVESVAVEQKRKIASKVATLISECSNVYLDSGSTMYRVSIAVANLAKQKALPNLHIFTNSVKNLEVLQGIVSVTLSGGEYRPSRRDLCGLLAENAVSCLHFDLCVLGADGIDKNGLTTTDFDTARLCSAAIKQSDKRILAADSSKFGKTSLVNFAALSDISTVVTDSGLSSDTELYIKSAGVNLITV